MKKIIIFTLLLSLLLSGCAGQSSQTDDASTTSQTSLTETATEKSTVKETTKATATVTAQSETTTASTEPVEAPLKVTVVPNDLTNFPMFSDDADSDLMHIVSIDDTTSTFAETPYPIIGMFDVDSHCALAVSGTAEDRRYHVVDQSGKDIEPTHQYANIERIKSGLYYGYGAANNDYVFDSSGTIYGALPNAGSSQFEPLTHALYTDGAIYDIDETNKQISKIDQNPAVHYAAKHKLLADQFNIAYHQSEDSYSYADGDNVKPLDRFTLVGDYAIVESVRAYQNGDQIRRYGLIRRGGEKLMDVDYYVIRHLAGDYFAVSTNTIKELDDAFSDHRYYDNRSYKKAIYLESEQLTEEIYYTINHVVGDVFHVFDGESYYFIDALSGQPIWQDIKILGDYSFHQVYDTIIAVDQADDPHIMFVIKDDTVVAEHYKKRPVSGGYVTPEYIGYGTTDYYYPVFHLEDDVAEQKLNDFYRSGLHYDPPVEYYDISAYSNFEVLPHPQLIQIEATDYVHGFGAAHPNSAASVDVFLPDEGEKLTLDSWFKKGASHKRLLADIMLQDKENMEKSLYYTADMSEDEIFEMFDFDNADYYFTEEALIIQYNPYYFASYAEGYVQFTIPLQQIRDSLTPTAKKLLFN